MTCQIIANKYSNYEYMDGQIKDMKTEIVEFKIDVLQKKEIGVQTLAIIIWTLKEL